jgi:hypothetical protein
LYSDLSRTSILHCDAFVLYRDALKYLLIDWRLGGRQRVALDAYLISDDASLTPVWDAERVQLEGTPLYWTRENDPWMRAVHARVFDLAGSALDAGTAHGRWSQVSTLAHYVRCTERDPEPANNEYKEYTRKLPDAVTL